MRILDRSIVGCFGIGAQVVDGGKRWWFWDFLGFLVTPVFESLNSSPRWMPKQVQGGKPRRGALNGKFTSPVLAPPVEVL